MTNLLGQVRRIQLHLPLALLALLLARPQPAANALGAALVALGLAVRASAAGYLEKGGPLCTDGPYRRVRHPLYLGSLLAAVGFSVMMNTIWAWVAVLPAFVLIYTAQVISEERTLRRLYGDDHARWAAEVPMLLPRLRPAASGGRRWSWARFLSNREQYHILVTLVLLAMFWLKLYWTESAP